MAEEIITKDQINLITKLIPSLINQTADKLIFDYDREADVLYISLNRPQDSDDSILKENRVIYQYRQKKLVGITILDASERSK